MTHIVRSRDTSDITEKEGLFELRYKLTSPKTCSVDTCKGYKFQHLQGEHMRCSDYQEIKIQVRCLDLFRPQACIAFLHVQKCYTEGQWTSWLEFPSFYKIAFFRCWLFVPLRASNCVRFMVTTVKFAKFFLLLG